MRMAHLTLALLASLLAGCATVDDGPAGHAHATHRAYGTQSYDCGR